MNEGGMIRFLSEIFVNISERTTGVKNKAIAKRAVEINVTICV
jgi:hypothetical protein